MQAEDVWECAQWSSEQWGQWLRGNLTDHISEKFSPDLFSPLSDLIVATEPINEQLGQIYEYLSSHSKDQFVSGVGIAVRNLERSRHGLAVFRILLDVLGYINVAGPRIDLLAKFNDEAFLSCAGDAEATRVISLALNVAAGTAPAANAREFVEAIATSPRITSAHSVMAWDALVRTAPAALADHLTILADKMPTAASDLDRMAISVTNQVSGTIIRTQLPLIQGMSASLADAILKRSSVREDDSGSISIQFGHKGPIVPITSQLNYWPLRVIIPIRKRAAQVFANTYNVIRNRRPVYAGEGTPPEEDEIPETLASILANVGRTGDQHAQN